MFLSGFFPFFLFRAHIFGAFPSPQFELWLGLCWNALWGFDLVSDLLRCTFFVQG